MGEFTAISADEAKTELSNIENDRISHKNEMDAKMAQDSQIIRQKMQANLNKINAMPKGSEDSCETSNEEGGLTICHHSLFNGIKLTCQVSGAKTTLGELKQSGWLVTNVSTTTEGKDSIDGKNCNDFIIAVKKIK